MNKDQIKGKNKETLGAVEKEVGKALGSEKHQAQGTAKELAGKIQGGYGNVKHKVGQALDQALSDEPAQPPAKP